MQCIWDTAISSGDYSLVLLREVLMQYSYTMEKILFPFLCHMFLTKKKRNQLWRTSRSMAARLKSERCGRRYEFFLWFVILTLVSIPCFVFPFGVLIWSTCREQEAPSSRFGNWGDQSSARQWSPGKRLVWRLFIPNYVRCSYPLDRSWRPPMFYLPQGFGMSPPPQICAHNCLLRQGYVLVGHVNLYVLCSVRVLRAHAAWVCLTVKLK